MFFVVVVVFDFAPVTTHHAASRPRSLDLKTKMRTLNNLLVTSLRSKTEHFLAQRSVVVLWLADNTKYVECISLFMYESTCSKYSSSCYSEDYLE